MLKSIKRIVLIDTMNLLSFDLNLLRVLDALLREQSTVKAGRRIGLSQPAVSSALGRLRLSLDDPLFIRQGQRIVPTDFARSLEAPLRGIFDDLGTLLSELDEFDPSATVQDFKIAGSDFFADMLMPKVASAITERAPGMRVQLVNPRPDDFVGTIESYAADLALTPLIELPDWVERMPVFKSQFVLIARNGNPELDKAVVEPGGVVPLDLFCELRHVLVAPQAGWKGPGDTALSRIGRARRVVMTMPVFSGVYNLVARSDFVALLPHQLADDIAPRLGLSVYDIPVSVDPATIYMIWHKRRTGNAAHHWLRSLALEILSPLDEMHNAANSTA